MTSAEPNYLAAPAAGLTFHVEKAAWSDNERGVAGLNQRCPDPETTVSVNGDTEQESEIVQPSTIFAFLNPNGWLELS